jgi:2-dehydropantoate 2-reductase
MNYKILAMIDCKKESDIVKIAIVGAGAMGSMYGGYLSNGGNEVYLIDIWEEHVNKINKDGLTIQKGDQEILAYPKAVTKAEDVGIVDLAVIFVKSIHTGSAVKSNMALFGDNTMLLSLQNGYGNIEKIEKYAKLKNIIADVVFISIKLPATNTIIANTIPNALFKFIIFSVYNNM